MPSPQLPPPRPGWWQREGATSRVLAIAGAVITLIGVVLLLVLAVQNGYLAPVPRVIGGAVLAAALIGAGMLLRKREGRNIGAVALAATGTAGLYLDVVAATAFYGWLPVWLGLLLGFLIAAGGLVLADLWDSETYAVVAVLGAAALSPALIQDAGPLLTSFVLVLSVVSVVLQLRHRWSVLFAVRVAAPTLMALVSLEHTWDSGPVVVWTTLLTCVLVTVAGATFGLLAVYRQANDPLAVPALGVASAPTLIGALALHYGSGPDTLNRWEAVAVLAGLAALAIGLRFGLQNLARPAQLALTSIGAVAVLAGTAVAATLDIRPSLLFVESLVLVVFAHRMRSKFALALATGFGVLGGVLLLAAVPPSIAASAGYAERHASWPQGLACLLLAVAAAALIYEVQWARLRDVAVLSWVFGGLALLYGFTSAAVITGVLAPIPNGFVAGHTSATIVWMAAALALLGRGLRSDRQAVAARVAGLLLAGAAVAKLLLFDLAALDGILRVLGFLVVGLLLIAAGTRYAKALAKPEPQQQQGPVPAPPMQGPPLYR